MGCFKCGVSESKARLFDAISGKGIVKICEKCSSEEDIPIIKRPTTFQLKESERKSTVYERLSHAAGIIPEEKKSIEPDKELLKKQETTLRDIIDKNYIEKVKKEAKPRPDLIDNFHWIIMRARRHKHLTPKQLGEEIQESEAAIKMAEQGVLPEDDNKLINKIESYLGIRLAKKEIEEIKREQDSVEILKEKQEKEIIREDIREEPEPTGLAFDPLSSKNITIANLKEMKKKRETEIFESSELTPEEEDEELLKGVEEIEEMGEEKEPSQGEIDDIIFGRK